MRATVVRMVGYAAAAAVLGVVVGTLRESPAAGLLLGLAVGGGVLGGIVLFELGQRLGLGQ